MKANKDYMQLLAQKRYLCELGKHKYKNNYEEI